MPSYLLPYLPTLFMLIGLAIAVLIVIWLRWQARKKRKRPPFTKNLLRSPGETLRRQLDDVNLDLAAMLVTVVFAPALIGGVAATQLAGGKGFSSTFFAVLIGAVIVVLGLKVKRTFDRRNVLQLAWEGELAVGEELNQLMLQGYRVFHDFPAEHFNIDHVVIGPRGVFAIETKTRSKALRGAGADAAKVAFNGSSLEFPDHRDTESLEQAKRQANWLGKWLASAVGEPIPVEPVIVLPGWFVNQTAPTKDLYVLGSGNIQHYFKTLGRNSLSPKQVVQVAHQIDQRCRTVEPRIPGTNADARQLGGG